jgi:hypothetical protein
MTIFGVPWTELSLDDVSRFLNDAGPEPLLWEAKGIEVQAGEVRRQVCGFANSHEGGYLIVGATQEPEGRWLLEGVVFPDEPPTWVSNVVGNGGVNPYPEGLDTKSLPTDEGKHVAVIRVPTVATPPCNAHGTVWERVSGRTISVREPLRLAQLFARGDHARKDGQAKAHTAAREVLVRGRELQRHKPRRVQFGLGLGAAGYLPDVSSRLFSPGFEHHVLSCIGNLDHGPHIVGGPTMNSSVTQDSRLFESEGRDDLLGRSWLLRATWHGAIAIYWVIGADSATLESMLDGPVRQAWQTADELLETLGPLGPRYLELAVAGGAFFPNVRVAGDREPAVTVIGRGPIAAGVDTTVLKSIERELRRATGQMAYESPGDSATT